MTTACAVQLGPSLASVSVAREARTLDVHLVGRAPGDVSVQLRHVSRLRPAVVGSDELRSVFGTPFATRDAGCCSCPLPNVISVGLARVFRRYVRGLPGHCARSCRSDWLHKGSRRPRHRDQLARGWSRLTPAVVADELTVHLSCLHSGLLAEVERHGSPRSFSVAVLSQHGRIACGGEQLAEAAGRRCGSV